MSSAEDTRSRRKGLLIKLAILGIVGAVGAVLLLRGVDLRYWIDWGIALVREAGPTAFFAGMALLPAVGFPLSPFTLSAGSVFAPTLGWPAVIAATWIALSINVSITYVGARWLARPLLEKLVHRLGYTWPMVSPENQWNVTVLVRVTPGPPFVVQSVILGLARIPFGVYLVGSVLIQGMYATAFVVFGDALLAGKGKMFLLGISAMMAVTAGAHMLRRHLAKKKALLES